MTTKIDVPEKTKRKQARQYLIALLLILMLSGLMIAVVSFIVFTAVKDLL